MEAFSVGRATVYRVLNRAAAVTATPWPAAHPETSEMTERINGLALWKLRRPHIRPKFLTYCLDPYLAAGATFGRTPRATVTRTLHKVSR